MKQISIGLILSAAMLFAVEDQTKAPAKKAAPKAAPKAAVKTTAKATPKPAPKQKAETEVPKGATLVAPGTYRWVDQKNVSWIYQITPFGLMKAVEGDIKSDPVPTDWKITDEGDALTFEKPYPFGGVQKWTRKKAELTDMEQAVWKQSQAGGSPTASTGK
jgi:hypothetical protein